MKIHTLAIHNLHSLASPKPIVIDFGKHPLQGCGLFAITGPTGAGKTTILDALTLALYGEIARQGDGKEVMSHGEGQCSAEVIFETTAGCYKARWALHRANKKAGGKFQNAVREIACWKTKNVLATKVAEVEKLVDELVGLNKEQFLKSVLLAQGQFMDFLKADKNERALLLEKLTGTEIYRGLSKTCFEKHKEEKRTLEDLQRETSATVLLSNEEKETLAQKIEGAREEAQQLREHLDIIDAARHWHQRSETLLKEEAGLQESLQKALAEKARNAEAFALWEAHSRIAPLASSLEQWRDKEATQKTLSEAQPKLQKAVAEAADFLRETEAQLSERLRQKEEAETLRQEAEPKLIEALKDEEKLAQLAESITRDKVNQKLQSEKMEVLSQKTKAQEAQLSEVRKQQAERTQWLAQNRRDGQLSDTIREATARQIRIATLRTESQALQKEIRLTAGRRDALHQSLLRLRQEHQTATKHCVDWEEQQTEIGEQKAVWKYALTENLGSLRKEAQKVEADLAHADNNAQALAFYLEHHQKLVDGAPCHLCGSTVHPYAARDLSEKRNTLASEQETLRKLRVRLSENGASIISHEQLLFSLEDVTPVDGELPAQECAVLLQREETLRVNIARIRRDIELGTAQIGKASEEFYEEEMKLARLQSDEQELWNEGGRLAQYFQLTASTLGMECAKNGEDVFVNALREKLRHYEQQQELEKAAQTRLADLENLLQNLRRESEERTATCAQTGSQIQRDEEAHRHLYEAIRQTYPAAFDSVAAYYKYVKEATQNAAEKWQAAGQECNAATQRYVLAEQEGKAHEAREAALAEEVEKLSELLCNELNALALPQDLSAALAQLIPVAERRAAEARIRQMESACVEAQTLLTAKQKEHAHHTEETLDARPPAVLEAEWKLLQKEREVLQQQIGRDGQILAENAAQEAQLAGKLESQKQQEGEVVRWRMLNDLIGSYTGDKLAGFAQTLSLEHLLSHANIHLRQLSDRYRLRRKTDVKESLGIQVEDLYLGGVLREAGSLSGGETFLVSLGLALGLSDMASQKTRIDSLFIDEGFGSLDSEALEDALTTLESLQARGKTIGIISHVEQLKERISTQIVVQKKGSGVSAIEVVG